MPTKEPMVQIGPRIPFTLKHEIDIILAREGKELQDLVIEQLSEYAKEHGEGNPIYALDKWVEEPKFKAVPALFSKTDSWYDYLSKCNDKEKEEIYFQFSGLKAMMEKRGLNG